MHTHEQRAVFRAERNWLVNAKFLLNAGEPVKRGEGEKSNIEKGDCSPSFPLVPGALKSLLLSNELPKPVAF